MPIVEYMYPLFFYGPNQAGKLNTSFLFKLKDGKEPTPPGGGSGSGSGGSTGSGSGEGGPVLPVQTAVEPSANTGLVYNGSYQYGLTGGSNYVIASTAGNSAYGVNAGSYSTVVAPADGCMWADGTSYPKTIAWSIAKGNLPVSMASSSASAYTGSTYDVGYSYAGDGTVKDENGVAYRVTAIAKSAFKGAKITKATLGSYVKNVGSYAFHDCSKLTGLTLGKSVASVGTGALKGCPKLKTVTVKSSKLTKASIKNLVKGTKVVTIKCSGVSKKAKALYAKWVKAYNKKASVK